MTNSEKVSALLKKAGATHKKVHMFGKQCHITCYSYKSAEKAAELMIQAGWTLRNIVESINYNKINKGTCLVPTTHKVYLAGLYLE